MDWKDSCLKIPCTRLSCALVDFCDETLSETKQLALSLLDELRSCRVTLNQLRKVDAVEFVAGPLSRYKGHPGVTSSTLDEPSAGAVKSYLMNHIGEYRAQVVSRYQKVVPQDKPSFEAAFDAFVEASLLQREAKQKEMVDKRGTSNRTGARYLEQREGQHSQSKDLESSQSVSAIQTTRSQWFEDQVRSGAGQPHLWKVFVVFQKQLRDACEAKSKEPLPPPLFSTLPNRDEKPKPKEKKKKKRHHRGQRSRSKSVVGMAGDQGERQQVRAGSLTDMGKVEDSPWAVCDQREYWKNVSVQSGSSLDPRRTETRVSSVLRNVRSQHQPKMTAAWMDQHAAIIGPDGRFIPVHCTRA